MKDKLHWHFFWHTWLKFIKNYKIINEADYIKKKLIILGFYQILANNKELKNILTRVNF